MGAGGAALTAGLAASSSTAAAEDGNGEDYCHEIDGNGCMKNFDPGDDVVVSIPGFGVGTWENCCSTDNGDFDSTEDRCPPAGSRGDGATGTVLGTCAYSDFVLVLWDSDNTQSHIAPGKIVDIHGGYNPP